MDLKGKAGPIFYSTATLDGSNIYMLKAYKAKAQVNAASDRCE